MTPSETNTYEYAIHLRVFLVARSQDPQREGHGHGGMKRGMGRAKWDEVWAIDEQLSGLPVGARLSIEVITSLAARRCDCGGFRGRFYIGFGLIYHRYGATGVLASINE
jgi:hypothetical protein